MVEDMVEHIFGRLPGRSCPAQIDGRNVEIARVQERILTLLVKELLETFISPFTINFVRIRKHIIYVKVGHAFCSILIKYSFTIMRHL